MQKRYLDCHLNEKTSCQTDAINMNSDKYPLIVFPWCILDGSASYRSCEVQPVWYAECKFKFLSFLLWHYKSNLYCQDSRWIFLTADESGGHGNSMCFTSFLYFPQDKQLSESTPIAELEAIKSRDIFALFWGQAFCRLGNHINTFRPAYLSHQWVTSLTELKPQNATYGASNKLPSASFRWSNKQKRMNSFTFTPPFSTWQKLIPESNSSAKMQSHNA